MADMIRKSTHTTAETDAAVDMIFEMYTRDEIDDLFSNINDRLAALELAVAEITGGES